MADTKYMLTENALRELKKIRQDVQRLNEIVRRRNTSGPRGYRQTFAKVTAQSDGVYDGTQVTYDGTTWQEVAGGIEWASGALELHEANGDTGAVLDNVYAVDLVANNDGYWWTFTVGGAADDRINFKNFIASNGNLGFYDGTVWVQGEAGVDVTDGGGFDLTDAVYWVETVTPYGADTTVNDTIQSGPSLTEFLEDDGTSVTTRHGLAEVYLGDVYQWYEGDIHVQSLYTPQYGADYRGATANVGKYLGFKDATGTADNTDFEYFFEGIDFEDTHLAGEITGHADGTAAVKFGGISESPQHEFTSVISTDGSDFVGFRRGNLESIVRAGLTEAINIDASIGAEALQALGKWVQIEPGAIWKHAKSPVTDKTDADHWKTFGWDGTNMTVDGTALSTLEVCVDKKGHIWEIDGTGQPEPQENFLYRHCTDSVTYPDLIFATNQGPVIAVDGECYELKNTATDADVTAPAPTVDGTFLGCTECDTTTTYEQWKNCTGDANVAVLSAAHTDVDYAWLCVGGVWVKSYNSGNVTDAATDPTVLKQCGVTTPTDCTDLVGWPAEDDFGGTGCNSGAVDDQDWDVRFDNNVTNGGSLTIAGAKTYHFGNNDNNNYTTTGYNATAEFLSAVGTAQFEFEVVFSNHTLPPVINSSNYSIAVSQLEINGTVYQLVMGDTPFTKQTGVYYNVGGTVTQITSVIPTGATFKFVRNGTSLQFYYNGNLEHTATIASSAPTLIRATIDGRLGSGTGYSFSGNTDNFYVKSGGSTIYVDPTGASCT